MVNGLMVSASLVVPMRSVTASLDADALGEAARADGPPIARSAMATACQGHRQCIPS